MQNLSAEQRKKIRSYALAMAPFIAYYAYELSAVLPHRPLSQNIAHGFTIAMGGMGPNHATVYISVGDLALILGVFGCAFAIGIVGVWRVGLFKGLLPRRIVRR